MRKNFKAKLLSKEEETSLWTRWISEKDYDARNKIIEAYTPFVLSVAQKFMRLRPEAADDIKSFAVIGLIEAAETYDPDKGFSFSSYARHSVMAGVRREYLFDSKAIHVTASDKNRRIMANLGRAKIQAERNLQRKNQDLTTPAIRKETARILGVEIEDIAAVENAKTGNQARLDAPVSAGNTDDGSLTLADILADDGASPEDIVITTDYHAKMVSFVQDCMAKLPHREQTILNARILCEKDEQKTLPQLGRELGISSERVRQLQIAALETLSTTMDRRMSDYDPASGFMPVVKKLKSSMETLINDQWFTRANQSTMNLDKAVEEGLRAPRTLADMKYNSSIKYYSNQLLLDIRDFLHDCSGALDKKSRKIIHDRFLNLSAERFDLLDLASSMKMNLGDVMKYERRAKAMLSDIVQKRLSAGSHPLDTTVLPDQTLSILGELFQQEFTFGPELSQDPYDGSEIITAPEIHHCTYTVGYGSSPPSSKDELQQENSDSSPEQLSIDFS